MTSAGASPMNILLVEDSKTDAILIERALSQTGAGHHLVTRVETLAAALRSVSEAEFDVVLLDFSLPDTAGFSGLLSIQNMAPKLPVVILTGHADEALALQAVEHGAQDYLFKDQATGATIKRAMQYALKRKQFESVLIAQANFDLLTGLANRLLFESRLDLAMARKKRDGAGVGIFFLDLDRFKQINDTMGHAAGDQLLKQVGERLKQSIRPYDTAARFGGDEFALIIEGLERASDCAAIADKILQRLAEPFLLANRPMEVGVSIGIATCMADEDFGRDILVHRADLAMYEAKAIPESTYRFYNAT